MNVALGVSVLNPLAIKPGSVLVSSISIDAAGAWPQLDVAAILTVVSAAPPAGSFRPAFIGDHKVKFNKSQLDYSKLRSLTPSANAPSLGEMENRFQRPWLDYINGWSSGRMFPKQNMPRYGRGIATLVGEGALMLNCNFTNAQKEKLLINFVQVGIDYHGTLSNHNSIIWVPEGGISQGRKFPILFAGILLGDPAMSNIGSFGRPGWSPFFQEDSQTFYVRETSPGVFNNGDGGYTSAHKDMPEWGMRHGQKPAQDLATWDAPYRVCCTANSHVGFVLAARIMGLKSAWNHDAIFDYQDRYIAECRLRKLAGWKISWSGFNINMWDKYRSQF